MSFVLRISQSAGGDPLGALTRREVEAQIEGLITILDRLDGDPDLEDDGSREPSLGWSTGMGIGDRNDLEVCDATL